MRGVTVLGLLAVAACADPPPLPDVCATDRAPPAPVVLTTAAGRDDVTAANLRIDVSAPLDPDGDLLRATDYEVWTANADGSARELVWSLRVESPHPPPVVLGLGTYLGSAAAAGQLEPWRDHLVRARQTTVSPAGCEAEGAWSGFVGFRTDDGSAIVFDELVVRDVAITLSPASYAAINAEAEPPGCVPYERSYHVGDVTFMGQTFAGAGVKVKGGCGSARQLDEKAAFKISLDWDDPAVAGCPVERRINGLSGLTLNNMVQDKSFAHERLAYALFRQMGVPAPRTAPVRVTLNGAFMGHYLDVETVDRRFLARHFGSNHGMLYEGTYSCQLEAGNIRDDDTGCLAREFHPDACEGPPAADADPEDYTPLRTLVAQLAALPPGGFYPAVTQFIDWDRYLSMWAVEALLSHWDGYSYNVVNNYRIYHDPATGLWTIIPSGVDQTFGSGSINIWGPNGRLAERCLAEPACEAAFAARLREAVDVFVAMQLEARRQAIYAQLVPLITAMPGREFDRSAFDNRNGDTARYIANRPAEVLADLAAHGF